MAVMVPDFCMCFEESHEDRIYNALRDGLSDDYRVFHGMSVRDVQSAGPDLEADFVIFHPKKGVLVIESKYSSDGSIEYRDGKWFYGSGREMKDPYGQASRFKHNLMRFVGDDLYRSCKFLHAVWFLNVYELPEVMAPNAGKDRTLTENDFNDVRGSIEKIFSQSVNMSDEISANLERDIQYISYYSRQNPKFAEKNNEVIGHINELKKFVNSSFIFKQIFAHTNLSKEQAADFIRILCPEARYITRKKPDYADEILKLTEEQKSVLDFLKVAKSAAIYGAAGTGKTFLAVEKAHRLAKSGRKVLFLCYNKRLCKYLTEEDKASEEYRDFVGTNLFYYNIDKLAYDVFTECNLGSFKYGRQESYEMLSYQMFTEDSLPDKFKYDDVIVDEAQDFGLFYIENSNFLIDLKEHILENGGVFYTFLDANQIVQGRDRYYTPGESETAGTPACVDKHCCMTLSVNCRNTVQIAKASIKPMASIGAEGLGLDKTSCARNGVNGEVPEIAVSDNLVSQEAKLQEFIKKFEAGKFEDIKILTCDTLDPENGNPLVKHLTEGGRISRQIDGKYDDRVFYHWNGREYEITTCRKFKGLEADAVIIVDVARGDEKKPGLESFEGRKLFYVGASRAKFCLGVICSMSAQDCRDVLALTEEYRERGLSAASARSALPAWFRGE